MMFLWRFGIVLAAILTVSPQGQGEFWGRNTVRSPP